MNYLNVALKIKEKTASPNELSWFENEFLKSNLVYSYIHKSKGLLYDLLKNTKYVHQLPINEFVINDVPTYFLERLLSQELTQAERFIVDNQLMKYTSLDLKEDILVDYMDRLFEKNKLDDLILSVQIDRKLTKKYPLREMIKDKKSQVFLRHYLTGSYGIDDFTVEKPKALKSIIEISSCPMVDAAIIDTVLNENCPKEVKMGVFFAYNKKNIDEIYALQSVSLYKEIYATNINNASHDNAFYYLLNKSKPFLVDNENIIFGNENINEKIAYDVFMNKDDSFVFNKGNVAMLRVAAMAKQFIEKNLDDIPECEVAILNHLIKNPSFFVRYGFLLGVNGDFVDASLIESKLEKDRLERILMQSESSKNTSSYKRPKI